MPDCTDWGEWRSPAHLPSACVCVDVGNRERKKAHRPALPRGTESVPVSRSLSLSSPIISNLGLCLQHDPVTQGPLRAETLWSSLIALSVRPPLGLAALPLGPRSSLSHNPCTWLSVLSVFLRSPWGASAGQCIRPDPLVASSLGSAHRQLPSLSRGMQGSGPPRSCMPHPSDRSRRFPNLGNWPARILQDVGHPHPLGHPQVWFGLHSWVFTGFRGDSDVKNLPTVQGWIPGLGRSPGEGNAYPL